MEVKYRAPRDRRQLIMINFLSQISSRNLKVFYLYLMEFMFLCILFSSASASEFQLISQVIKQRIKPIPFLPTKVSCMVSHIDLKTRSHTVTITIYTRLVSLVTVAGQFVFLFLLSTLVSLSIIRRTKYLVEVSGINFMLIRGGILY